MTFLWLAVLAHITTDFILQTDDLARMKAEMKPKAYLKHGLALLLCTLAATHIYGLGVAFAFSAAAALVHTAIDYLKNLFVKAVKNPGLHTAGFVLDQAAHLYILYLLWTLFSGVLTVEPSPSVLVLYSILLPTLDPASWFAVRGWFIENLILSAVVVVYVLFGGAVFIRMQLDCFNVKKDAASAPNIGKCIGLLERALILMLVMRGEMTAAGFVLAAKSIARFKQLDDRTFAEYYLVGTLISTLVAVGGGLALNALWH
ncbi:MAG: DUF3307 domain-containing protein [Bacillota bacterium]